MMKRKRRKVGKNEIHNSLKYKKGVTMRKRFVLILLSLFFICSGCYSLLAEDIISGAIERGKYKRALANLMSLSNAIHAYLQHKQKAPDAQSMEELEKILVPFYMRTFPRKDSWGNGYYYKKTGEKTFLVGCGGGDGKFAGFKQEGTYSIYSLKGQDIIITYKKLIYGPEEYTKYRWFKTQ